jgi:Mrp family chromosome partitioning ATPase
MEQTANLPGIGIKPLLSLKRHYRISIILFFLVLIVGSPMVWIKGKSTYSAEAIFQVAPRYMKNLESDSEVELQSNSQYREFVNHLQNTVIRYDVLERALAMLKEKGIDTRPAGKTQRQYIERLQKTIVTRAIPDTYMVRIGLNGGPDDKKYLHAIINAVMASFLETAKSEQIYGSAERFSVLKDTERKLRDEIAEMDLKRAQLGERLGLTTFTDGVQNPYDQLLAKLREELATAEIERRRAESTLKAFKDRREVPTDLGRSLLEMRLGDLSLVGLRAETAKRIDEFNQKIAGLAEKHPARAPAEEAIKALRDELSQTEAEFDRNNFANFDARLSSTLQQRTMLEEGIRQNVADMESQASSYAQTFQSAMQLTHAILDRSERIKQIQKRLNYLETESNALGFVRLVTPALPAEMPQGPGKTKLLLGLIVAAFGAAMAVPLALDMFYSRIRSVNEAEKLLGMPAAGWQIQREDLPTQLYAAEQCRRFAAALMRLRSRNQRNVFAFTAVKARGGTTSTILDTASTLVGLGARVLVVEANSFTPFAAFDDFRPGLSELLLDDLPPDAVIHPYRYNEDDKSLEVVGIGTHASAGLQRLDRLRKALDQWGSDYEYVLFDLPPILLSADAEMLIEMLGQVFLVVQAESVTKGEINRAKRLLQKIDPEAVGLFVNGVPLFRGSGYMEQSIIETVTRLPFGYFASGVNLRLHWEMLRTRFSLNRRDVMRKPFAWLRLGRKRVKGASTQPPQPPQPPQP